MIFFNFPSAHLIILFGSYARDEWVEDIYTEGHITYEYMSDFDVLVLTRLMKTANNHSKQNSVDDLILQHKAIKTPVSVIYHSVGQVNYRLKEGRYFFSDIKKEGILLYDSVFHNVNRISTCGSHYLYSLRHFVSTRFCTMLIAAYGRNAGFPTLPAQPMSLRGHRRWPWQSKLSLITHP